MANQNKYQNGKIFKIISNSSNDIYIGATCEPRLVRRLSGLRKDFKRYANGLGKIYQTSFKLLEKGDYQIILIENFSCNNKDELRKRERYWIELTPHCVNKCIPTRTHKEYNQDNKEKSKEYYKTNRDKIIKQTKQWKDDNKEKYNIEHVCECGITYKYKYKSKHNKTDKHTNYIKSKEIIIICGKEYNINTTTELYISNMKLNELPKELLLLTKLNKLNCKNNNLTKLDNLPSNLEILDCSHNKISNLDDLPPNIIKLKCGFNEIETLDNLPKNIIKLCCDNNKITKLDNLPITLELLNCCDNQITTLDNLPTNLQRLYCKDNITNLNPSIS